MLPRRAQRGFYLCTQLEGIIPSESASGLANGTTSTVGRDQTNKDTAKGNQSRHRDLRWMFFSLSLTYQSVYLEGATIEDSRGFSSVGHSDQAQAKRAHCMD